MKNTKKIGLLLVSAVLLIAITPMISAYFTSPLNTTIFVNNATPANLNISTWNGSNYLYGGLINCTFYKKSTSANQTVWDTIGNFSNYSAANVTGINGTFFVNATEDASDWEFRARCCNYSEGADTDSCFNASTSATIVIDKSTPTTPTLTTPSSYTNTSIVFSATVVGNETTTCELHFDGRNPNSTTHNMTHSGDACTLTLTNIPEESYNFFVRATDDRNTTDSSTQSIRIDYGTGTAKMGALLSEPGVRGKGGAVLSFAGDFLSSDGGIITIIAVIVVIVAIVIYRRK